MDVHLNWNAEPDSLDIPPTWIELLQLLLAEAAAQEKVEGEVSLTFVDDETIRELNQEYRGIDQATDVLSFPLQDQTDGDPIWEEDGIPDLLGDIVISVPTARRQCEQYGHSIEREIGFLFVHGFLHLLGYDHEDEADERKMFRLQDQLLQKAGVTR